MSKYTDWYPAEVKPVRVGWYHIFWNEKEGTRESNWNWWWDGKNFHGGDDFGIPVTDAVLKWRGLKSPAK